MGDLTYRQSFDKLWSWLNDVRRYAPKDVECLIIGNKTDLISSRNILHEEAQALADSQDLEYFETSAKSSSNVNDSFSKIVDNIMHKLRIQLQREKDVIRIEEKDENKNYNCACK